MDGECLAYMDFEFAEFCSPFVVLSVDLSRILNLRRRKLLCLTYWAMRGAHYWV